MSVPVLRARGTVRERDRPAHGIDVRASRVDAVRRSRPPLPAWPLLVLLHGFPLAWAAGAAPFVTVAMAGVMGVHLILHGQVRLVPGLLPWFAFLAWLLVSGAVMTSPMQAVGFVQRAADLVAVGIVMLYYVNARTTLGVTQLLRGFFVVWTTLVVLGVLAILFPEVRLTTPIGQIMPGALVENELVRDLVSPRLAEVQQPWGAEEPYNRPAAPFPYANAWGMAYVLLTPLAVLTMRHARRRRSRVAIAALVGLSVWPALETSNRGMLLGLAVYVVVLTVRSLAQGRGRHALGLLAAAGITGGVVLWSGAADAMLGRQEVSNTTEGRESIYRATLDKVAESPIFGWATPEVDPTIGIALGTQGYAWTLLYCYGVVGLLLFAWFLLGSVLRTRTLTSPTGVALHGLLVTTIVTVWFYGLGVTQLTVVCLVAAALLRARHDEEELA